MKEAHIEKAKKTPFRVNVFRLGGEAVFRKDVFPPVPDDEGEVAAWRKAKVDTIGSLVTETVEFCDGKIKE